jgi:hypothetical protein
MPESTRLIDKIRINAKGSDRSNPASYVAGLRDAEEFIRGLEALPVALADKKHERKQQFLRIVNGEEKDVTLGSATD